MFVAGLHAAEEGAVGRRAAGRRARDRVGEGRRGCAEQIADMAARIEAGGGSGEVVGACGRACQQDGRDHGDTRPCRTALPLLTKESQRHHRRSISRERRYCPATISEPDCDTQREELGIRRVVDGACEQVEIEPGMCGGREAEADLVADDTGLAPERFHHQ